MENNKYEILKNKVLQLPIMYSVGDCENVIDDRLKKYHELLVDNKIFCDFHERLDDFRKEIKDMFSAYYLGYQNKAYEHFKTALKYIIEDNQPVMSVLPKEPLYRARNNTSNTDFEKNEMFHIKFDERSKVKTQRFSFPGLPCLYVGGSSYVCWLELDRPQMDQFQVAEIRQKDVNKNYKVIDLCIHPSDFYKKINHACENDIDMSFEDYIRWWPIMALCSIAVKNENNPFKPEYIIPQFVLQYFLEEDIKDCVGIKYMSIKAGRVSMEHYKTDYRIYSNYVIPVKSIDTDTGFCPVLSKIFEVVETVSGKEHNMICNMIVNNNIKWVDFGDEDLKEEKNDDSLDEAYIYTKNGFPLLYSKSTFRLIEKILSKEVLNELSVEDQLIIKDVSSQEIKDLFKDRDTDD